MICREALLWKKAQHKYVLPFLGIDAQTFSTSVSLISPWMHNGTINVYMQRNGDFLLNQHVRTTPLGREIIQMILIVEYSFMRSLRGWNICITKILSTEIFEE